MRKNSTFYQKAQFIIGLFILTFGISIHTSAQSTCTLDPVFIASPKYGIWPDSATNFASGQVGQPYAQNITVKVPLDTVQSPIKICFTRFELLVPPSYPNYNLPPGLTLTGNPSNLKFPGNANSCAIISGTPTTAGTYTLHFQVDVYGTTILSSMSCPTPVNPNTGSKIQTQNIDYYVISISPASGINELTPLSNLSSFPNPAKDKLNFTFNSQTSEIIQLQILDLTGKLVKFSSIESKAGSNSFSLDISELENGIYFYSLSNKDHIILTNKFILNK
ncbi:MAG: hypothetical protein KatS3mg027_2351 [Bacteroidia bacterium]|nr:MAG: hypothetical protein KatS3mg027_2351 [Bacteroidia bacterium]